MEFQPLLLKSLEKLQYQATPGELSIQTGLPLAIVEKDLQQLAIAVGGHLQVSNAGEVIYKYPSDFQNILRQKFVWLQVQEWLQKIWKVIFYLVRVSFGIVLIASVALILLSIFALSFFNNEGDGIDLGEIDLGGSGDSGGGGGFIWWWFDWGHDGSPQPQRKRGKKLSFLNAVYSFLFGDGNPNANLEELRWRSIGQVIRKNRGAITAEQVAPYLDNVSPYNEDHILPVLLRFNGLPEVSPVGDLVYRFPDSQTFAQQRKFKHIQPYLKEKIWKFSAASTSQKWTISLLAAVNFGGALFLGLLLKGLAVKGGIIAVAASLYWVILLYAIGFISIPIGRWLWLQWANGKIRVRNQLRSQHLAQLAAGSEDLTRKLQFAENFQAEQIITAADLAYTTEDDLLDQEMDQFLNEEVDPAPPLPGDQSNRSK
jgi:hypothetical protein